MGIFFERLYADPIMTVVTTFFMVFLATVPMFKLLELAGAFEKNQPGRGKWFAASASLGALLWLLLQLAWPTAWGEPVALHIVDQGEEQRLVVVSARTQRRRSSQTRWCAVRTFTAEGEEVGSTLWTGGCHQLEGEGPVRFFASEAGLFTYEHARVVVDFWTGEEPFRVDDALAEAALPGEVRSGGVEKTSLRLEVQDGSSRFLTPAGEVVDAPVPGADDVVVRSSREPGDKQANAFGVFDAQELGCGLVLFRQVAFGEGEVFLGGKEPSGTELAWRKPLSALDLSEPVAGFLETPEGCWVVGGSVVLLDEEGTVKRQLDL